MVNEYGVDEDYEAMMADIGYQPRKEDMAKKEQYKTFSDHYAAVEFYPDHPKRDLENVLNNPYIVLDCHIVKGFKSQFGESDFALILMKELYNDDEFTVLCGGEVVVRKLSQAKSDGLLPLYGTIVKPAHYYDII